MQTSFRTSSWMSSLHQHLRLSLRCLPSSASALSQWSHSNNSVRHHHQLSPFLSSPLSNLASHRSFSTAPATAQVNSSSSSSPSSSTPTTPASSTPSSPSTNDLDIRVSDSCKKRLLQLSHRRNQPVHLRVVVDQGGCSGLEYKFHSDAKSEENDIVVECATFTPAGVSSESESVPIHIYIDPESYIWLKGCKVDFHEELSRALFIISDNPNAENACGCKSSFAPKNANNKHLFQ